MNVPVHRLWLEMIGCGVIVPNICVLEIVYVLYTITTLAAVWETSTVCHLNTIGSPGTYVTVKVVIVGLQDFPDC